MIIDKASIGRKWEKPKPGTVGSGQEPVHEISVNESCIDALFTHGSLSD